MSGRKYVNRGSGGGRGFVALTAVALLALVIAALFFFILGTIWEGDGSAEPAGRASVAGGTGVDPFAEQEDFAGSDYALSTREAQALWTLVRDSEYVGRNLAYRTVLRNARFHYGVRNGEVNAYAGWREKEQVRQPYVELCCGMTRLFCLAALAVEADAAGVTSNAFRRLVLTLKPEDLAAMTERRSAELFAGAGLAAAARMPAWSDVRKEAKEVEFGALLCFLAHEAGHLAFGHGHRVANESDEIVRNMEREADSFSFSVISSSQFRIAMMKGYLLAHGLVAFTQRGAGADVSDHPLSLERLSNHFQASPRFKGVVMANSRLIEDLQFAASAAPGNAGADGK